MLADPKFHRICRKNWCFLEAIEKSSGYLSSIVWKIVTLRYANIKQKYFLVFYMFAFYSTTHFAWWGIRGVMVDPNVIFIINKTFLYQIIFTKKLYLIGPKDGEKPNYFDAWNIRGHDPFRVFFYLIIQFLFLMLQQKEISKVLMPGKLMGWF